jgi:hypothetical protein
MGPQRKEATERRETSTQARRVLVGELSAAVIRRIPNTSAEAAAIYAQHGTAPGKLALVHGERWYTGRVVVLMACPVILRCLLVRIASGRPP